MYAKLKLEDNFLVCYFTGHGECTRHLCFSQLFTFQTFPATAVQAVKRRMFPILTSLVAFTGKFLRAGNLYLYLYRTMMSPMGGSNSHSNTVYSSYSSRMTLQYEQLLVREVTPVLVPEGFGCTHIIVEMFTVPIYIYRPSLFNKTFNYNIFELFLSM